MVKHIPLLMAVAALGVTSLAPAADARPRRDHREQDAAYKARQQGRIMSLRTI